MENKFKQVEIGGLNKVVNKAIAVLRYEPDELERILDIKFSETFDGLDFLKISVLEIGVKQICLVRYKNNPSGGTEVWVSKTVVDIQAEVEEILTALGFDNKDLRWMLSPTA